MTNGPARPPADSGGASVTRASVPARVERVFAVAIRLALILSCICLAGIIIIGTADTLGRLMGRPMLSSTEMTEALLAAAIFSALPTVQHRRGHVVVDLIKQSFGARMRYATELLALLIACFIFFLLARQGLEGAIASARQGEVSAGLVPIPVWMAKCVAAGGLILTVLEAVRQIVFYLIWPSYRAENIDPDMVQAAGGE